MSDQTVAGSSDVTKSPPCREMKDSFFCTEIVSVHHDSNQSKYKRTMSRVDFRLNFTGKTNRVKEMLTFTILANFVHFPCISDGNLFILLKIASKLPCA